MQIISPFNFVLAVFVLAACDAAPEHEPTPRAEVIAVVDGLDTAPAPDAGELDIDREPAAEPDATTLDAELVEVSGDATPLDTSGPTDTASSAASDPLITEGEALFMRALAGETSLRGAAILALSTGLLANPEHARGQLMYGMALLSSVAEDQNILGALQAQPALEKAMALAPGDLRIPGWLGTVKVGAARVMNSGVDEAVAFMLDAADAYPEFNNVSLAIAFGRFGLDTPYPQMAIDRLVATADCAGDLDVCRNTERVPHNNEGALMLFGDVFARIGDHAKARYYYELALASPDAATWDYAGDAQAVLDDLDDRIDLYLDADPANDPVFFAEGRVACVACHAP